MGRFSGRRIIVTGASRGIGQALAATLAAEGADLLLVARTVDRHDHLAGSLAETADMCRLHGGRVEVLAADLSDADSRATIVPFALECFDGRVDVLVNNAAAAMFHPVAEMSLKRRRLIFEVNVHAPVDLATAVLPSMVERGEGWIVNVSSGSAKYERGVSVSGFDANNMATYGGSKAALNRMTVSFGGELYGTGVRVNTIEPRGGVRSEGATALVDLADDQVEPMEAMVAGTLVLCDCAPEMTGGVHVSLDLLGGVPSGDHES